MSGEREKPTTQQRMAVITVKASDYDKLAEAARWLRRACKDRLPPGHYDKVSEECRNVDAILCPNAPVSGPAKPGSL